MKKTFIVEVETSKANWKEIDNYKDKITQAVSGIVTRWDMSILVRVKEVKKGKGVR